MTVAADPLLEQLLTVDEVAALTRTSKDHVYRLIRQRQLGGVRIGRRVLVHPADLRDYVTANRVTV